MLEKPHEGQYHFLKLTYCDGLGKIVVKISLLLISRKHLSNKVY